MVRAASASVLLLFSRVVSFFFNSLYVLYPYWAGFYADVTGLSSCLACENGTYAVQTSDNNGVLYGATTCTPCGKGSYNSASGQGACLSCAVSIHWDAHFAFIPRGLVTGFAHFVLVYLLLFRRAHMPPATAVAPVPRAQLDRIPPHRAARSVRLVL